MLNRKSIVSYTLAASILLSAGVSSIDAISSVSYAAEQNIFSKVKEINEVFLKNRENVNFKKYIPQLKEILWDESIINTNSVEAIKAAELLATAIINSIDVAEAKLAITRLEALINKSNDADIKVAFYSTKIRLHRMLGDLTGSDKALAQAIKFEKTLKEKSFLGFAYLAEAHGDVVDLNMQESTVKNLDKAIEYLKNSELEFAKEKLLLAYVEKSQVELYYNKDASTALSLLEETAALSDKFNNEYYSIIIDELKAHTYPFFLRYEEGINALRPIVKKFEQKGYYSEAYRAQDKLVTLAFDSGDTETALSEGSKLESMRKKVVNTQRKKYFEEYSNSLYQANVYASEGKLDKAIQLLNSKKLSEFSHVYSIDNSIYHMYLGNLNYYNGDVETALKHYQLMMRAIENNSNGESAYVYTDTSMALAQAYYDLGKYKEGFDILSKHLTAYLAHDMQVNKRDTAKLTEQYKAAEKDKEILALKLESEKKSSQTTIASVLGVGLSIITGLIIVDLLKVKKYNKILSNLSTTDGLTGLSNRRALDEFLGKQSDLIMQVSRAAEKENSSVFLSALMMDIDYFKSYNDNYGHTKGDKILKCLGEILKPFCVGESDLIARYGGEEFALILTNIDKHEALQVAAKIKKAVSDAAIPHEYSKVSDVITVSIGVATKNIPIDSIDTLIEDADKALYYSKNNGRNTFTHFSDIK